MVHDPISGFPITNSPVSTYWSYSLQNSNYTINGISSNTDMQETQQFTISANGTYVFGFSASIDTVDANAPSGCYSFYGQDTIVISDLAVAAVCSVNITATHYNNGGFAFLHDALPAGFDFGSNANNTVSWDFGDNTFVSSSTTTLDSTYHDYTANGNYLVQFVVSDSSGLSGCYRIEGNVSINVTDAQAQTTCTLDPNFVLYNDTTTADADDFILLDANGNTGYDNLSISWGDNTNSIINISYPASYPVHIYASGGQYSIRIIAYDSLYHCMDTTDLSVSLRTAKEFSIKKVTFVGPNGVTAIKAIAPQKMTNSLYPNPANELVTLTLNADVLNATAIVYDLIGNQVVNQKLYTNQTQLNTKELANGIYSVVITSGNTKATSKLVVAH